MKKVLIIIVKIRSKILNLGPDENQERPELPGRALQQLEDVGEDADTEGEVHRPGPEVQESPQQIQCPQSVSLAEVSIYDQCQMSANWSLT